MTMLAAAASTDPTAVFLQYGVVGALCVVLAVVLSRVSWAAYKRERERADKAEAKLDVVNERITTRLEDVVRSAGQALAAANEYLRDLAKERGR
jgi:ElaB/YqjD/DUF883 family membrane-anchored ribosome-binding protein